MHIDAKRMFEKTVKGTSGIKRK